MSSIGKDRSEFRTLPTNVTTLLESLRRRKIMLEDDIENTSDPATEIDYKQEIKRTEELIALLELELVNGRDSELSLTNIYENLSLGVIRMGQKIQRDIQDKKILSPSDLQLYNTLLSKYNLYVHVVETL